MGAADQHVAGSGVLLVRSVFAACIILVRMCGIVGYVGNQQGLPIALEALRRMEYRGYDSAGIAVAGGGELNVAKRAGKLQNLEDKIAELGEGSLSGTTAIGHTRWATHGLSLIHI